jgi:chromosomal replication initiation ATPase DnaA
MNASLQGSEAAAVADLWERQAAQLNMDTQGAAGRGPLRARAAPSAAQLAATMKVITDLGADTHLAGLSKEQEGFVVDVVTAMVFADVVSDARDSWPFVIALSGGPGTGKTHTLTALVNVLRHLKLSFLVGATTHAAA